MKSLITIIAIFFFVGIQSNAQSVKKQQVIGEMNDRIVKLYPNPATTYITFDLQDNYKQGYTIYIFNAILGKKMYEAVNVSTKTTIQLNDFSRGMYLYHLIDASGKIVESGKFQVSK